MDAIGSDRRTVTAQLIPIVFQFPVIIILIIWWVDFLIRELAICPFEGHIKFPMLGSSAVPSKPQHRKSLDELSHHWERETPRRSERHPESITKPGNVRITGVPLGPPILQRPLVP